MTRANRSGLTIGIATLSPEIAAFFEGPVSDLGHDVTVVRTKTKVAEKLIEAAPSAVVIDIEPDSGDSGPKLARKLAQQLPTAYVVCVASDGADAQCASTLAAGADGLLTAPWPVGSSAEVVVAQLLAGVDLKVTATYSGSSAGEIETLRDELRRLGVIDPVTQAYNDRFLDQRIKDEFGRAKRYGRPLAFVAIDVDGFTAYRKAHGEQLSSFALRQIVSLLQYGTRLTDAVCRRETDEFALILPETDLNAAVAVAEKARRAISDYKFPKADVMPNGNITVSIGCAETSPDTKSAADLIQNARNQLHDAKARGGDTVRW